MKQDLLDDLDAAGLVDSITTERMYPTLPTAVAAYLAFYEEEHGKPHPFGPVPPLLAPPATPPESPPPARPTG